MSHPLTRHQTKSNQTKANHKTAALSSHIKPRDKPGLLPPTAFSAKDRQPRVLGCSTYIITINLHFYFRQMSQLVFVSPLPPFKIKIRSYLKCAAKCKLKSVIAMAGGEGFQDGHQEPGTCSTQRGSHPSGTDLCKGSRVGGGL